MIPNDIKITPELIASHGLKPDEYDRILELIGREPSFTELGIFSAMWNEHCSYKSSKKWLKTLPTEGPRVLQGPGENAGVVDIGDGQAVVFKMESHNHPSYIEPYQGAATGVGGILRDVLANDVPLLLQPADLYAVPAALGATVVAVGGTNTDVPHWEWLIVGSVLATGLRLAGLAFKWRLPTAPRRRS